jgi:hypothetical protein
MENTINWRQKLTSRKLWLAIVGVVIGAAMAFGVEGTAIEEMVSRVAGAVTIMGSIFKYLDGESAVDAARAKGGDLAALLQMTAEKPAKNVPDGKEDLDYLEMGDTEK